MELTTIEAIKDGFCNFRFLVGSSKLNSSTFSSKSSKVSELLPFSLSYDFGILFLLLLLRSNLDIYNLLNFSFSVLGNSFFVPSMYEGVST